jgi:leucyl aminopeptidase
MRALWSHRVRHVQLRLRGSLPPETAAAAVAEGAVLGLFDPGLHRSESRRPAIERLSVSGAGTGAAVQQALERGALLAEATNAARSLVSEPANHETGGQAGASVGAAFLREFTEGRPWGPPRHRGNLVARGRAAVAGGGPDRRDGADAGRAGPGAERPEPGLSLASELR